MSEKRLGKNVIEVNVNELCDILKSHFKIRGKHLNLASVTVANLGNQYSPRNMKVGLGGVCTLHLEKY